ncbi:MAG: hypothetical protein JWM96_41 [Alphaproteobacteria bacterium]|nr:hypothetical protein [Alphaproteobacteria bacterium]
MIRFSLEDILIYSTALERKDRLYPFAARHHKDDYGLCFIAARHEYAINSETHRLIDRMFAEFQPKAVILEGLTRSEFEIAWDKEIEDFFVADAENKLRQDPEHLPESSYTLLKAKKNNIVIFSGEPTEPDQIDYLVTKGYSADDFAGIMFLWGIAHWRTHGIAEGGLEKIWRDNYRAYRTRLSDKMTEAFGSFQAWFLSRSGPPFDLEKIDNYFVAPDMSKPFGTIPHLSGTLSHFRDINILETIQTALNAHRRVMVVYGGSHYRTLKPALDNGFGSAG